jgi:hypothetical protein
MPILLKFINNISNQHSVATVNRHLIKVTFNRVVTYDLFWGALITEEKQPVPPSRGLEGTGWKGVMSIAFHSPAVVVHLFKNFQHRAFFDFGRDGVKNGPHGLGGTALLSDNLADVFLGNTQFQHHGAAALNGIDPNFLGAVHEGLYNPGDQFIYLSCDGVHFPFSVSC